ncbi:TPA: 3-isopropylmalate dehydrogenase [candidate division WOR-3 bacterium]|jgi:3-isopropylmalate dehydrogenase|uniref:3-isopropylmalate dehydrogenase n=1 Tax=candidate division WOR-3 bacterium TaxID=2052148 RepID=A0A350H9V4_UNCW3|nr:3-isopropylmalate dehydrogenase [candidate division WOR-3 bacterium]
MSKYKIAWMPGDGIGVDVMEATKIVLDALKFDAEYIPADIGWEIWRKEGDAFPKRTIDILNNVDAALFGAITSKPKEEAEAELVPELKGKGLKYLSPIVRMRQMFNLYSNLRPCKAYKGNPLNFKDDIDIVVFRENTEDLYAGVEYFPVPDDLRTMLNKHPKMKEFANDPNDEMAISLRIMTKDGCTNIVRSAFEYAKKYGRKKITLIEKPNVIRETSGMMTRIARAISKEYPSIKFDEVNVDAACMWLVKNPESFDVIVTSNMFGDIVSDLAAQLVGGLGFASSGNIGDKVAVFEPTHGSAPKYAGQHKVNPIACILAAKLMLDYLKEEKAAGKIENAVARVIMEGKVRTYDMGGKNTSLEVAKEIASKL